MGIDLDEYRSASHDNWNRIAGNWERNRDYIWSATRPVSERIVERAAPESGDTVLDIAAGTGDTGFLAAERIDSDGHLITTDFAEEMVQAAERAAGEKGIDNAEFRVLDAEKMDLEDSSVDRVISRWGYMLMADPGAALAETRRVLRDGGTLSFAVWDTPDKNLWAFIPGFEMVQRGHLPPPEPGVPGIFALGETDRIKELVTGAGFDEPEIEQVEVDWDYEDPEQHWRLTLELAGPLAEAITNLDEDEREAVRLAVREKIEEAVDAGGVTGRTHVVTVS
jgi:ubiquinone/menaquinone biosynthesis C-methylase UbiE